MLRLLSLYPAFWVALFLSVPRQANAIDNFVYIGFGIGTPYAMCCMKSEWEFYIMDYMSLATYVSAGEIAPVGFTMGGGLNILFMGKYSRVRPGFVYYYGANSPGGYYLNKTDHLLGRSLGLEIRTHLGSNNTHFIDLYLVKRITPKNDQYHYNKDDETVTIAGGYTFRFNK